MCTPSIPAPSRKRRKANKALLKRLSCCEALENFSGHVSPFAFETGLQQLSKPSIAQYGRAAESILPVALESYEKPSIEDITQTEDDTCFNSSLSYHDAVSDIGHCKYSSLIVTGSSKLRDIPSIAKALKSWLSWVMRYHFPRTIPCFSCQLMVHLVPSGAINLILCLYSGYGKCIWIASIP